jgi:ABC-type sulfate transport system permease component
MIKLLFYILGTGYGILILAILLNILAGALDIITWYDFLLQIKEKGFTNTIKATNITSLMFLFIVYPLLLGLMAYFVVSRFIPTVKPQ